METDKIDAATLERLEATKNACNRRQIFNNGAFVRNVRELKPEGDYAFKPPVDDVMQHTVIIKRAVLGKDVDPSELCMIELETRTDAGSINTFPLAYLRGTDMLQIDLDLVLTEYARLKLSKGKGPVFVIGEYAQDWKDDEVDAEESLDGDAEVEAAESEEEDMKENDESENKENSAVQTNGTATVVAADRKRKHDGTEVVGGKKIRVSKGNEEAGEEAMDDAPEKITT